MEKRRSEEQMAMDKLRFERELDEKTKMQALEKKKLAMEKRRIEEGIKKEWLRNCFFFATLTISAAILANSFYVSTKGWHPIIQDIGSTLNSFVRWLYRPFSVELHGDSEELAKLSGLTSGK